MNSPLFYCTSLTSQVLAFQKSWRRLALSLYVLLHNASAGPRGGEAGGMCPHEETAMSVLKKKIFISSIYMYGNGLVEFGVFRGRRFSKKEISHIICTVMVWWSLGWFWGV